MTAAAIFKDDSIGLLGWNSGSSDEFIQDVKDVLSNGARLILLDIDADRGTVHYTIAVEKSRAVEILGYQPEKNEWLDIEDLFEDDDEDAPQFLQRLHDLRDPTISATLQVFSKDVGGVLGLAQRAAALQAAISELRYNESAGEFECKVHIAQVLAAQFFGFGPVNEYQELSTASSRPPDAPARPRE